MARPGKSTAEKIAILDEKIAKQSETLKSLKEERAALADQESKAQLGKLLSIMKEKNLTVDDVLSKIRE